MCTYGLKKWDGKAFEHREDPSVETLHIEFISPLVARASFAVIRNIKIKLNPVTRARLIGIEAVYQKGALVKLYGLRTCDTCRKALKSLATVEFYDLRADGLPEDVAQAAYARFGADLVNRRSTTWRQLPEAERARDPLALLADHPTLMKRPLIDDGGTLYLGWGKDTQAALLG